MKTCEEWEKSGLDFTKFCSIGDEVDAKIVDHFVNILPPIRLNGEYVQVGEPDSTEFNRETGQNAYTFCTFARENGTWIYKGACFIDRTEKPKLYISDVIDHIVSENIDKLVSKKNNEQSMTPNGIKNYLCLEVLHDLRQPWHRHKLGDYEELHGKPEQSKVNIICKLVKENVQERLNPKMKLKSKGSDLSR